MGFCYNCVKCMLVLANFLFLLIGLGIVALATWMLVDQSFYISLTQDTENYLITTYILLGIGVLLFIISFLGCCGACRESNCMLISFFCLLLIVLAAQVASAIWAYINIDSLEPLLRNTVKMTVQEEYHKVPSRKISFDALQSGLACCGADKPSDWIGNRNEVVVAISVAPLYYEIPQSCCRDRVDMQSCKDATKVQKVGGQIDTRIIYNEGCSDKLINWIKTYQGIICIVPLSVMLIEFIGMLFAIILMIAISRQNHYKG